MYPYNKDQNSYEKARRTFIFSIMFTNQSIISLEYNSADIYSIGGHKLKNSDNFLSWTYEQGFTSEFARSIPYV